MMDAREAAFKIINSFDQNKYELDTIIDQTFDGVEMDVRDKRLAFQIVYGVLRNRKFLDYVINQFLNNKLQAENLLVIVLEVAVYQILFLDRVPAFAAVNEAVNFTKNRDGNLENFTGVTNAVLRNIIKNKKKAMKLPESMERVERLSLQYSHPHWLINRWMKSFGGRKTENLLKYNNEKAITYLRRNTSAVSRGAFEADIAHVSPRSPQATGFNDLYYELKPQVLPTDIMSFGAGMCTVQAPSSGWVVALLNPEKSNIVLDVSAAPGGKTTLIADLLDDKGAVVACDNRFKRAELIVENIKRTRTIDKVYTVVTDGTLPPFNRKFDKILLDAPCSGTGVIQRHPDSRWMRKASDITNAVKLQKELLLQTANLVEVGGVLVYSTCSLESEENWDQVEWFLENNPKFELEDASDFVDKKFVDINGCLKITPYDHKMDGMFGARLKRVKG